MTPGDLASRSPPPLPPRTLESRNKPPTMRQPPRLPSAFPGATDEDEEDEDDEEDCDDGARYCTVHMSN